LLLLLFFLHFRYLLLSGTDFTHGYTVDILASCGRYLRWRLVGADVHLCKVSNLFIWCIPKFMAKNYIPRLLSLLFLYVQKAGLVHPPNFLFCYFSFFWWLLAICFTRVDTGVSTDICQRLTHYMIVLSLRLCNKTSLCLISRSRVVKLFCIRA
jgi:hypothetical protein